MDFRKIVAEARDSGDYSELISTIPYAVTLGVECERFGDEVLFKLPRKKSNIGNPILPAIHGGVIGGFMEISASLYLMMFQDTAKLPKIVDISLDYLRAGLDRDTYVECKLTRQGSRVANVIVTAWQKSRDQPIALARAHFLFS